MMCSRFINWLKTWEYGLVGPDRIVFGSCWSFSASSPWFFWVAFGSTAK